MIDMGFNIQEEDVIEHTTIHGKCHVFIFSMQLEECLCQMSFVYILINFVDHCVT